MEKCVIVGAGVSGLTAATHLTRCGIQCVIIEKNEIGGLARATWTNSPINGKSEKLQMLTQKLSVGNSNSLHTNPYSEYCWHAIGSSYYWFIDALDTIEYAKHLVRLENYVHIMDSGKLYTMTPKEIKNTSIRKRVETTRKFLQETELKPTYSDWFKLAKMYTKSRLFGRNNADILWSEECRGFSPKVQRFVAEAPSIYMGMDTTNLSAKAMYHIGQTKKLAIDPNTGKNIKGGFYFLNRPYNELFEHWKKYLEDHDCEFIQGEVTGVRDHYTSTTGKPKILYKYMDNSTKELKTDIAHAAIIAADPFSPISNTPELAHYGYQQQTQVVYALKGQNLLFNRPLKNSSNEKTESPLKPTVIVFIDSPWFLMARVESTVWSKPNPITEIDGCGEILSVGIGISDKPGLNGKTMLQCTADEIKEEVWNQMKTSSWSNYNKNNIIYADIWKTFKFENGQFKSSEPKFSNSVKTDAYRKYEVSSNPAIMMAGSHRNTDAYIYNMEGAAESGTRAATAVKKYLYDSKK